MLTSGLRVITTSRKSIKWPVLLSDASAAFFDELDPITPSDPGFDDVEAIPKAIKALITGSSESFDDSDPDLLQLLVDHLHTVLALRLDRQFLVGKVADNAGNAFDGLNWFAGVPEIDLDGTLDNYDPFLRRWRDPRQRRHRPDRRGRAPVDRDGAGPAEGVGDRKQHAAPAAAECADLPDPAGRPQRHRRHEHRLPLRHEPGRGRSEAGHVGRGRPLGGVLQRRDPGPGAAAATLAVPFADQVVVELVNSPAPDPSEITP